VFVVDFSGLAKLVRKLWLLKDAKKKHTNVFLLSPGSFLSACFAIKVPYRFSWLP